MGKRRERTVFKVVQVCLVPGNVVHIAGGHHIKLVGLQMRTNQNPRARLHCHGLTMAFL